MPAAAAEPPIVDRERERDRPYVHASGSRVLSAVAIRDISDAQQTLSLSPHSTEKEREEVKYRIWRQSVLVLSILRREPFKRQGERETSVGRKEEKGHERKEGDCCVYFQ